MKTTIMLRLAPELKQRLKIYAIKHGKSASAVASEAIQHYLNSKLPNPAKKKGENTVIAN